MSAHKAFAFTVFALLALLPHMALAVDVKVVAGAKGGEVWFVEDHTVPIIAMSAAIPAGSAYDPHGKDGLSAMAAALMDEGAGKMTADAFQSALGDKAIQLSVSPGRDYAVIRLVTLADNAKEAFRLLGLAITHPRFDPDAINRIRAQMIESIKQGDQDPATVAAKEFNRRFFGNHPYAHPVGGSAETLATINQADLRAFARAHWVRGGMKVSVSGDVDEATLKTLLSAAFDAIPASRPAAIPALARSGAPGVKAMPLPVPQPSIAFGLPGILRSDKDFIPAYVANYILGGGGFSSRLMNEVREKRGLTYGISTDLSTYSKAGMFSGRVATKKESVTQTIEVIRQVMKRFAEQGATPAELADAKTYLTGSFPLAFASNTGIAAQLNSFQRVGLPRDYITKRNALIEAVTQADIRRVAKRLFDPAKLTIVVGGTYSEPKTK